MKDLSGLIAASKQIYDFLKDYESSDEIAGYAACPECLTVFAGFRIHDPDCDTGTATDAAKFIYEELKKMNENV